MFGNLVFLLVPRYQPWYGPVKVNSEACEMFHHSVLYVSHPLSKVKVMRRCCGICGTTCSLRVLSTPWAIFHNEGMMRCPVFLSTIGSSCRAVTYSHDCVAFPISCKLPFNQFVLLISGYFLSHFSIIRLYWSWCLPSVFFDSVSVIHSSSS